MRQSGIIAAGALFALRNHIHRLSEDHENAQRFAQGIENVAGIQLVDNLIETNIVFFDVDAELGSAPDFVAESEKDGVLMLCEPHERVRALTHLDVNAPAIDRATEIVAKVAARLQSQS